MTRFNFRSNWNVPVEDPPELVWSSKDKVWFIEETAYNIETRSKLVKTLYVDENDHTHRIIAADSVTAVIVGFREFEKDQHYCAQFAAVVDGIRSRKHRFIVLTVYDEDAKLLVQYFEKNRQPLWHRWFHIGVVDGKFGAEWGVPTRETEGYFENKNFAEDLEVLAFLAENWAKGKKGLEAGQVFDLWWWDCKNLPDFTDTIPDSLV